MARSMKSVTRAAASFLFFSGMAILVVGCLMQQEDAGNYARRRLRVGWTSSRGQPRQLTQKHIVAFGGSPAASKLPLKSCEGDCDSDEQCGYGLVCFQKGARERVPGCDGGEEDQSNTDYCIPAGLLEGRPYSPNPPSPTPPAPAPTPGGLPPGSDRINRIGNNLGIPLGRCQGDCDSDAECQGEMICFQRGNRDSVQGCSGGTADRSNWDYCVPKYDATPDDPSPSPPSSGTFRLKLYWQQGYYWQEETRERKWCITHHYDGLPGNGKCWYGRTRRSCRDDQVYMAKCGKYKNQLFQFVEVSDSEILIKIGNGDNKCFERDGTDIFLRTCDSGDEHQRWYAPNGSFDGSRFELSQRRFSSKCMTQDHHPKAGEVVELHSCSAARSKKHETSFWDKY